MADCEVCSDLSQAPDLVPGQGTTCPGCGRRVVVPAVARPRGLDTATATALMCGSIALLLASIPPLNLVTKPLAGLGLLIGLGAGLVPAWKNQKPVALPIAVCALCLVALAFAGRLPFSRAPSLSSSVAVALHPNPKSMAGHPPVADDAWVNASDNAMQTNGLRVQVVSVRVGNAELKDQQKKKVASPEKYLLIQVRASYHGGALQHLFYDPWADFPGAPSKHPPTLTDAAQRAYAQITFDASRTVVGRVDRGANQGFLAPGEMLDEILVFPAAAAQPEYLRLLLPAGAFGVPGEVRLQIPRHMIKTF
jgi:hypothetical protein